MKELGKLKEILLKEKIQKRIGDSFFYGDKCDLNTAINKTTSSKRNNYTSVQIITHDKYFCDFENTLSKNKEKRLYLLQSKLVGHMSRDLKTSCFLIIDFDGNILECSDDMVKNMYWENV